VRTFSVVVPVFENEANLPDTVPKLLGLQARLPSYRLEIVFVEDGSSDRSLALLREYASQHSDTVRVVKLTRNFGQTPAIQAGLRHATGDCVGIISADLQEPYEQFVDMVRIWEGGEKFVIGERRAREEGRAHQFVSNLFWSMTRRLALPEYPSMGYDFCLLDRQIVDDINHINEKNSSIFALIYWLGYRPFRLPITRAVRTRGVSQWRLSTKLAFTVDTLIGFTYLPARVITGMGVLTALICLAYAALSLVVWWTWRTAPPGWMAIVVLVTLLGSMILVALGIVSEYLLRILDEARKRPPYVVHEIIGAEAAPRTNEAARAAATTER
jgi:dolichol-phosphate mannosyltransferase